MNSEVTNTVIKPLVAIFVASVVYFLVALGMFRIYPNLGKYLLLTALFGLWALFATVGIRVLARDALTARAAMFGAGTSMVIAFVSLWPTANTWLALHFTLVLLMCPPSILSISLDNAGRLLALLLWLLMIAPANAAIYALAAVGYRYLFMHTAPTMRQ